MLLGTLALALTFALALAFALARACTNTALLGARSLRNSWGYIGIMEKKMETTTLL